MRSDGIFLLCLVNSGLIALLPRKFFKQGAVLSRHFWLTAAPLFASPAFLALAYWGILPPLISPEEPIMQLMGLISIFLSSISIMLMGMAIGVHRQRIHMFHDQADIKATHLVTFGPYEVIRHPIYSSYLFALFSTMLFCPQIGTIACFVYGWFVLNRTAADEESRLSSPAAFGQEYVDYMRGSGRFLPPLAKMRLSQAEELKQTETSESETAKQLTSSGRESGNSSSGER